MNSLVPDDDDDEPTAEEEADAEGGSGAGVETIPLGPDGTGAEANDGRDEVGTGARAIGRDDIVTIERESNGQGWEEVR